MEGMLDSVSVEKPRFAKGDNFAVTTNVFKFPFVQFPLTWGRDRIYSSDTCSPALSWWILRSFKWVRFATAPFALHGFGSRVLPIDQQ